MKRIKKIIASGMMIVLLAVTMIFTAAEIGVVYNNDPVLLEALGSGGGTVKPSKKANPIKVSGKTVKIQYKKLVKKNQTVSRANAISVSKAKGTVTYKKKSGNAKIVINKKGVITVKKGLKAGTYKFKVNVHASGNSSYKAATKVATVTIKVITSGNPIVVSGKSVTVEGDDLALGNVVIARKNAIEVKNAQGKVTYKKTGGVAMITVNAKNGNITVESGLAMGTYKVKVAVTAAGNKNYKKGTETAVVEITVTDVTPPPEEPPADDTPSDETPASDTPADDSSTDPAA